MKNHIQNYNQIVSDLKKDYQKLTEFELLSLAIQIERNQILENGFVVSSDESAKPPLNLFLYKKIEQKFYFSTL